MLIIEIKNPCIGVFIVIYFRSLTLKEKGPI